jgi:signal transduction histidine kinase
MNAIGDLAILAASLFMAVSFWRVSWKMGRANEGTRLISFGLAVVAASAAIDAAELIGPQAFLPMLGTDVTEAIAYVGYSISAILLVAGFTRWLPLIRRLDKEVSGRARAETELNRTLDRVRRYNAGLEDLGKAQVQNQWTQTELIDEATRRLSALMGVSRVSVWTRDADGQAIECLSLYSEGSGEHSRGDRLPRSSNPAYFDAIEAGSTVSVTDTLSDPITLAFVPGYMKPLNIGAMLDAPIFTGEGVRGVVCCEHIGGTRRWTAEDIFLAKSVAQHITAAMLTDDVQRAADQAQTANEAKSTFLANMSHELRTPLNGMLGMAELIADTATTKSQRESADTLIGSGRQLLSVLNDVLDLTKMEAGHMQLRPEPTDMAALVRECSALFRPAAKKKGLALHLDLGVMPDRVSIDPVRVRQILSNLIANAVKFTEQGSVSVAAHVEFEPEEAHDRIVVSVSDTGCGISEGAQRRLFQRFSQVDDGQAPRHGGTGLGLVIARELAQRMDGDIAVDSTPDKGSRFTFSFLAHAAEIELETESEAPEAGDVLAGAQVLLVDDNDINRMVARCFIEPAGATVTEAASGMEALDALAEQAFDVVLLDAHMPKMDGLTTLAKLRKLPGGDALPVVVITADALAKDEKRYLEPGWTPMCPSRSTSNACLKPAPICSNMDAAGPRLTAKSA